MNKLSILIGIGFMLVSALSYTESAAAESDFGRLAPSLVGLAIALVGVRGLSGQEASKGITVANMLSCFLLIVYSAIRIVPDLGVSELVCNVSLIVYAMLFIFVAKRSMDEGSFDGPIL